eukprot:TRINITY_DN2939_c0_g1_i1.p1 TRINITY_DN2939_c0_g1~~TRINITY_DN2939_c0_g1_i1.p1  ORF type:complete len:265 (+),score=12.23 TRINITY_DN2939_c0_g1_i1:68-862(+)
MINVSVVVPTYKEAANLQQLTKRLFRALKEGNMDDVELIIVDDNSPDNTKEVCAGLVKEGYNIRLITRTTERGLSSAVLRGFAEAKGSFCLCMDADLQHPPESVPAMITGLRKPGTKFVLGTRYGQNGGVSKDWPLHRKILSGGARSLARPLSPLSDPMSGFFGIRKDALEEGLKRINPIGYKIALETYVKCGIKSSELTEVSFMFGAREEGVSKLDGKVMIYYLLHLRELYFYRAFDPKIFSLFIILFAVVLIVLYYIFSLVF